MTDNEIIKALECCLKGCNAEGCDNCPLYEKVEDCEIEIPIIALDLINRQKAEIEQLRLENRALSQKRITMFERIELVNNARTKAIREFAENVKTAINERFSDEIQDSNAHLYLMNTLLDDLVKEMTEGENGYNS